MDSFSYQDYILPYSTLKTSSQPFGHGIPEFSLTMRGKKPNSVSDTYPRPRGKGAFSIIYYAMRKR